MNRIALICTLLVGLNTVSHAREFADVPKTHWAKPAINELTQSGVVGGFEDGTFQGMSQVNRYQVTVMLHQLKKYVDAKMITPDTDSKVAFKAPVATPKTPKVSDEKSSSGSNAQLEAQIESLSFELDLLRKEIRKLKAQAKTTGS